MGFEPCGNMSLGIGDMTQQLGMPYDCTRRGAYNELTNFGLEPVAVLTPENGLIRHRHPRHPDASKATIPRGTTFLLHMFLPMYHTPSPLTSTLGKTYVIDHTTNGRP